MAWVAPRTWIPGETVTASLMNAHVRDDMNVLKTQIDDNGLLKPDLYERASAVGNSGAGNTDVATYTTAAGLLSVDGQQFVFATGGHLAANGNAKTFQMYFAGTLLHQFAVTTSGASWRATIQVARRGALSVVEHTSLSIGGAATFNTSTPVAIAFLNEVIWDSHTPTLANANVVKVMAQGTSSNDVVSDWARGFRAAA